MPANTKQTPAPNAMRVAEILSDLTSLRVVDPQAALALVSARAEDTTSDRNTQKALTEDDADIRRAKSLVQLHYDVKENHKRGELGRGLEEARKQVAKIAMEARH